MLAQSNRKSRKLNSRIEPRDVKTSHGGRVLFPGAGITKSELVEYYRKVAPVMLPSRSAAPADDAAVPERNR